MVSDGTDRDCLGLLARMDAQLGETMRDFLDQYGIIIGGEGGIQKVNEIN